eukprot:881861-Pelagomonas_calceolata.AAC.2
MSAAAAAAAGFRLRSLAGLAAHAALGTMARCPAVARAASEDRRDWADGGKAPCYEGRNYRDDAGKRVYKRSKIKSHDQKVQQTLLTRSWKQAGVVSWMAGTSSD